MIKLNPKIEAVFVAVTIMFVFGLVFFTLAPEQWRYRALSPFRKETRQEKREKIVLVRPEKLQLSLQERCPDAFARAIRDVGELENMPDANVLFPGLQWHETDEAAFSDAYPVYFRRLETGAEMGSFEATIVGGWRSEVYASEGAKEDYYVLLKKALEKEGWRWRAYVHGYELEGLDSGGPDGARTGLLKTQNGSVRMITVEEYAADGESRTYRLTMSDIISLADAISDYEPDIFFGAFLAEITPTAKALLALPVDYGALIPRDAEKEMVMANSPAQNAGLAEGDIILSFDGRKINETNTFIDMMHQECPGNSVKLEILRLGEILVTFGMN